MAEEVHLSTKPAIHPSLALSIPKLGKLAASDAWNGLIKRLERLLGQKTYF
jgi:hypothetical protein